MNGTANEIPVVSAQCWSDDFSCLFAKLGSKQIGVGVVADIGEGSPFESSDVAGVYAEACTHPHDELFNLQRVAQAAWLALGLVRPRHSWHAAKSGKRGRPETFSDAAIQACLTLKVLFGLPLRQTVGLVESLIQMVGLDWPVPDFSTLCRRQARIAVQIPYRVSGQP